MKLGIIGATGWLGAALGTRLVASGWPEADLLLLNRSAPRAAYAPWPAVQWQPDAASLCQKSQGIVLSVRPDDFPMPGYAGGNHLVISFMTAWSLERLAALHPGGRIVRAMPNGAAREGKSFTPWVAGPGLTADDRALVRRLLGVMGAAAEVDTEAQLDYLSALSGSGSAYPALMAQAMLAHARTEGLSDDVAHAAVGSVMASAAGLAGQVETAGALLETYLGYRGITAAGLRAAEAAGFQSALTDALDAARDHASKMTRDGVA